MDRIRWCRIASLHQGGIRDIYVRLIPDRLSITFCFLFRAADPQGSRFIANPKMASTLQDRAKHHHTPLFDLLSIRKYSKAAPEDLPNCDDVTLSPGETYLFINIEKQFSISRSVRRFPPEVGHGETAVVTLYQNLKATRT